MELVRLFGVRVGQMSGVKLDLFDVSVIILALLALLVAIITYFLESLDVFKWFY